MSIEVSLLTPTGRGAVATIGVRGPGARELVARHFAPPGRRPLSSRAAGDVAFGRFSLGNGACEEVVLSVPGPDEIEVHCHGGVAVAEAICQTLVQAGAVRIAWEGWIRQSDSDPIAAAALAALPLARTERTAAILLDQYRGALRSELAAIDGLIQRGEMQPAAERLSTLLARQDIGLHLTQPWRVVLTGPPNAGKSSLLNALVGYQRAIVFEEPGTTRDVLMASTAIDGWPIELADTAGLRVPASEIEAAGVTRAGEAIATADLVLLVVETTAPWDSALSQQLTGACRRVLIVHNKCDLAAPPADGRPEGVAISAKTQAGLDALTAAIAKALVPDLPGVNAPIPFTPEQFVALQAVQASLADGDAEAGRAALAGQL